MRSLVREDDARLVRLGLQRDDQPPPRSADAVGADVVLLERPERLLVVDEGALLPPGGEGAAGLLLRLRQGQMDDVVRAPLEVVEALLRADHVVRRSHQRVEGTCLRLVVADCPKRLDFRHGMSLSTVRSGP